jgi:hypothetical protein
VTLAQACRRPARSAAAAAVATTCLALCPPVADAADARGWPAGRYSLRAEVSMPHLEEGLRGQRVDDTRCLAAGDVDALFPLMAHAALTGCRLAPAARTDGSLGYWLHCANPAAASGTARIEVDGQRLRGTLDLKMGGKNMTLSQRVEAERLGDCTP